MVAAVIMNVICPGCCKLFPVIPSELSQIRTFNNRYLLSIFQTLCTVLDAEGIAVNKNKVSAFMEFIVCGGEQIVNSSIY